MDYYNPQIKHIISKTLSDNYDYVLPEDKLQTWALALSEYSLDTVVVAFKLYMKDNKAFKPNLASIRGYCMEIHAQDLQFEAERFADALIDACENISLECPLDFHSNTAHNAIQMMGGWANIDRHYTNQTKLREDFINRFLKCAYLDLPYVAELEGCQTDSPYYPKYELQGSVWVPVRRTNEQ